MKVVHLDQRTNRPSQRSSSVRPGRVEPFVILQIGQNSAVGWPNRLSVERRTRHLHNWLSKGPLLFPGLSECCQGARKRRGAWDGQGSSLGRSLLGWLQV